LARIVEFTAQSLIESPGTLHPCRKNDGSNERFIEKCGDMESEPEEETPGTVEEPVLSQSVIDAALDAQLTINLTSEFEEALKKYRTVTLNFKWKEFPEVKQYLKDEMLQDTHILTWREKWVVERGGRLTKKI